MICPRLQFAALSIEMLEKSVAAHPERELAGARVRDPNMSEPRIAELKKEYTETANNTLASIKVTRLVPTKLFAHDKRLQSIERSGYLENGDY